ncbi:hypothetical protein [Microcoleus sp. herbarium12]
MTILVCSLPQAAFFFEQVADSNFIKYGRLIPGGQGTALRRVLLDVYFN